jgi:hypothetical protein
MGFFVILRKLLREVSDEVLRLGPHSTTPGLEKLTPHSAASMILPSTTCTSLPTGA